MANSDLVTPSREVLRIGDIARNRAVAESIMARFAATNNFIATYQNDMKEWKLNGSYGVATGIAFYDGVTSFFYNAEIVGIFFYNGQAGVSGTTTFDIQYLDTTNTNQGSIFSTKPAIDSTASNNVIGFRNLVTGIQRIPTGVTQAQFSKTTFAEGESLYLVLDSAMVSAQNCGLTIFYRPIN